MSKSKKGKKRKPFSEEHKKKISESEKGKIVTEETKQKIRENHANFSGENNPMYGKHLTKEHKEQISKIHKGKKTNTKKVVANYRYFESILIASKNLKVSSSTIIYRIKAKKPGYYYFKDKI